MSLKLSSPIFLISITFDRARKQKIMELRNRLKLTKKIFEIENLKYQLKNQLIQFGPLDLVCLYVFQTFAIEIEFIKVD